MGKIKRKLPTKKSTSIENVSNEIFYEIFDYLGGCEIYESFSDLNQRFEQLLNSSSVLFHIRFHSRSKKLYENFFTRIISLNKRQICSLSLSLPLRDKHFFSSFTIDSSLHRLKGIALHQLKPRLLLSILSNLLTLPQLSTLILNIPDIKKQITNVYRIVLKLPMLEYFKFDAQNSNSFISLPIPNDQQHSPIKALHIQHSCTFNELSNILPYTPKLRCLYCWKSKINSFDTKTILPSPLINLKILYLFMYEIKHEQFELLISKIGSTVNTLRCFTLSEDLKFLDAIQWEELIKKYLPQLKEFFFQYREYADDEYQSAEYFGESDQFFSSFWIDRQWQLGVQMERNFIIYTIRPYQRRWYEFNTQFNVPFSKSTRLIVLDINSLQSQDLLDMHINRALTVAQIYQLEIQEEEIDPGALLKTIDLLPELTTLHIESLLSEESSELSEEEVDILLSGEDRSQITKVCLYTMMDITDIYFLMIVAPKMEYLRICSINDMDAELFIREILDKINHEKDEYLRLLSFYIEGANDELIQKLKDMIDTEKLIVDYSIKLVHENIFIQWK